MKKTLFRVVSVVLSLVLCVTAMYVAPVMTQAADEAPILAYVPLDNRPVCVDRIMYQAASAGFDVRMPEESLYATLLDGQGGDNATYGCGHGDGAAIMTWLTQMEASGCDHYIIHLDQLMSGGLVGSRDPDNESGGASSAEIDILKKLAKITDKKTDGEYENMVYIVDTVMRLASTGGYKGLTVKEYSSFREYAQQARKTITTTVDGVSTWDGVVAAIDEIYKNYQVGQSGETLTYYTGEETNYKKALTQAQVNKYHKARRRKLDILNWMRTYVTNTETTSFIFGVDDANPKVTIQTNEINLIHNMMVNYKYYLSADTDSAGMMAVARCATDYYGNNGTNTIPVKVRYYGSMIDTPADDYDIGTLRTNVQTHLESANCYVTDGEGEIELLVLTKIADNFTIGDNGSSTEYMNNIDALIAQANANNAANKPTIVVDCSTESNYFKSWVKGNSDPANYKNLQDELLENVDISKLLGYSNWNTVGNTLGIAIGQGVARYTYLKNEPNITEASHVAFTKAMTFSYMKDITYNARNKNSDYTWTFQYWIKKKAGGTGWDDGNFYQSMIAYTDDSTYKEDWESCRGEHVVNNELEYSMLQSADATAYSGCGQQVLNSLMAGTLYTDLSGKITTAGVGNVSVDKFHCPWYRQFEITFEITASVEHFYAEDASYMTQIPVMHDFTTFKNNAINQYGATNVVVKTATGSTVSGNALVGTGYTVTMTIGSSTKTYTAVVWGDVTGDALLNTSDVRDCLLTVLGSKTLSGAYFEAGDYDGNNRISSTDARQILQTAIMSA